MDPHRAGPAPEKPAPFARGRWLVLPEELLSRLAAKENLLGDDGGDVDAGLALDLAVAAAEVAQALAETGRPLRHLHLLLVSQQMKAFRRGYVEGARASSDVCNALARDLPPPDATDP